MTWLRRASSAAMVRAASGGVWNRRLDTVRFYERRGVGQHVNASLRGYRMFTERQSPSIQSILR